MSPLEVPAILPSCSEHLDMFLPAGSLSRKLDKKLKMALELGCQARAVHLLALLDTSGVQVAS